MRPLTGSWIEGRLSSGYEVKQVGDSFVVTGQWGSVIRSKKGESPAPAPTSAKIENSQPIIKTIPAGEEDNPHVLDAITIIQKARAAENSRDLDTSISFYADEVSYFGSSQSKASIRKDKASYFLKWPTAKDVITSPIQVEFIGRHNFSISFSSRFRVVSADGSTAKTATIANAYMVSMRSDPMKITQQSGKVSNLRKGHPSKIK